MMPPSPAGDAFRNPCLVGCRSLDFDPPLLSSLASSSGSGDHRFRYVFEDCVLHTDRREFVADAAWWRSSLRFSTCWCISFENRERVVSKDDLLASVWHGRIVSELALGARINAARAARRRQRRGAAPHQDPASQGPQICGRGAGGAYPTRASSVLQTPDPRRRCRTRPSIAVLPFTNMSGDPDQEYFADGIAEDLITALVAHPLAVRDRPQLELRLQGPGGRREAGRRASSASATCSKAACGGPASRLRISAQLIDAVTGGHLWAERYDRDSATSSPCRTRSPAASPRPSSPS